MAYPYGDLLIKTSDTSCFFSIFHDTDGGIDPVRFLTAGRKRESAGQGQNTAQDRLLAVSGVLFREASA